MKDFVSKYEVEKLKKDKKLAISIAQVKIFGIDYMVSFFKTNYPDLNNVHYEIINGNYYIVID